MSTRQCPDCKGKGKFWRPPNQRIGRRCFVSQPTISSTAGYWYEEELPEWYDCTLCGGIGEVDITPVRKAKP